MFKQFLEVFWPKAMEYVAEQGLGNALNIKDFEQILENLQENLKLLSAKAFDVETEIKNAEDSGRKKRKREVEVWLEGVKSIEKEVLELGSEAETKGFMMRFLDGGKAAELNGDIEKLVQQRLDFGEPVLDARGTRGETLLTNEMVGKDFNQNMERIWKLLEDRQVSKIGVYGMGGVGKTTLAKHIYNRLVQEYEGRVVWVTVSQKFTIKSLQDMIARFLGVELKDEDEEAFRATRLDKFLSQKNISVLILDDVWERIDMKRVGCNFAVECCRLIITTRSAEVCHRIGCKKLIPVVKLGKDEAWKLFKETLDNEIELGPQVEEIAKCMAEVCDGLPLGIITVAGSMKGMTAIHTWKNASIELKECVAGRQNDIGEVDEVFRVLKYSFDRLKRNDERASNEPNMIQHCFLYCSLYPEDYKIDRDDLIRKFISEGLLDERRSRREQVEQGHAILDKLMNLCLLESCVDYKNDEWVKMHDLVRSMALRICKGKYMVRAGDYSFKEIPKEEEWTKDLEKVSFMKCNMRIEEGISPDCPELSTLLLWGNDELKVIPESFFSKMQGLCTLDLCKTSISMLPDSVSDLTNLKALFLESCHKLKTVPYLGKLKALRELNLSATAIKEVPQGLEELLELRFLSIFARGLEMLPRGLLLKLGHLQHLNLPFNVQVDIEEIKNLKQLEVFNGGLNNVSCFNCFITTCGVHDPCYKIAINSKKAFFFSFEVGLGCVKNELVKNELVLCESNLKDEKVFGQGIADLTIDGCAGLSKCFVDDLTKRFNNPTSLRELKIWRCGEIECILRSDGQGSQFSNTLEDIQLESLDDLKMVVMERAEIVSPTHPAMFSSLRRLEINNCNKMRKLGLAVTGLPNLEYIRIWSCEEIEGIFEEDERRAASIITTLSRLNELRLEDLPRLRKVGLHMQEIPNLESIEIRSCGEIEEIFEEDEGRATSMVATLPKLERFTLIGLPKLKKVGLHIQEIPNLESIDIGDCGEIEEIFEEDEGRATSMVATLPKLKNLELWKLPKLKKVGLHIQEIPNLEEIHISDCGEIEEIFEEDEGRATSMVATLPKLERFILLGLPKLKKVGLHIQEIPNLEEIHISDCGEIEEIFEEDEGRATSMVATLPKLERFILLGLPKLKKVGLHIQEIPNLEEIHISDCGEIEEIFEEDEGRATSMVATLPKLKNLELWKLPKLKKVGLHIQEIPNLESIDIGDCGEIEEIFEEDEGRATSMVATLPKLKNLELWKLPKLKKVGLHIQEIPNLESIDIGDCGEIEEIFEEDEGRATSVLTRLEELSLEELPKLKSVSKPTIISNSIEIIIIKKCPRLMNKLPVHIDGPTPPSTLRRIQVDKAWWESLEWDININPNLPRLLQHYVSFEYVSFEEDSELEDSESEDS